MQSHMSYSSFITRREKVNVLILERYGFFDYFVYNVLTKISQEKEEKEEKKEKNSTSTGKTVSQI